MKLLFVLLYVLVGFVAVYGSVGAHLLIAQAKGYKAKEWWSNNRTIIDADNAISCLFGMLLWPVRLIRLYLSINGMYDEYTRIEILEAANRIE